MKLWKPGTQLHEIKHQAIIDCYEFNKGNMTNTAMDLGISVRGLRNMMRKMGYHRQKPGRKREARCPKCDTIVVVN